MYSDILNELEEETTDQENYLDEKQERDKTQLESEKADLDKWIRGHRVTSVDEMHATAQDFSMKQPMPTV